MRFILDGPVAIVSGIKAFNHALCDTGVTFFATAARAAELRAGFPKSLNAAPMLLPTAESSMRRGLDRWFQAEGIHPQVVAEFDDSALLKVFGQDDHGAFPAPTAIAAEVAAQYHVEAVGAVTTVRERYFLVTMHRRLEHPAVLKLTERARAELSGQAQRRDV